MWKIVKYHHRPCVRKGDTEAETIIESCNVVKTLKEAKTFVPNSFQPHTVKRGKYPQIYVNFTGYKWFNEGTGETEEEFFTVNITKE